MEMNNIISNPTGYLFEKKNNIYYYPIYCIDFIR